MSDREIHDICNKYDIKDYTIEDGLVNVDGDVNLQFDNLVKLPLRFGKIEGDFNCHYNNLTSLEGSPIEVGRHFDCSSNSLTSLNGAPLKVGKDFWCYDNPKKLSYEKYLKKMKRINKIKSLNV